MARLASAMRPVMVCEHRRIEEREGGREGGKSNKVR